jgi:hypothetical protein
MVGPDAVGPPPSGRSETVGGATATDSPARAAACPALAPGLAALMAWPAPGLIPGPAELAGLLAVVAGPLWAVTGRRG